MDQAVMIKSSKAGLTLRLSEQMEWPLLLSKIREKFAASARFFGACDLVLRFEGRPLTTTQELNIVSEIEANSQIHILCIAEEEGADSLLFQRELYRQMTAMEGICGQFHRADLKAGESLSFDTGVILLGNVEEGASLCAAGNLLVLGEACGQLHAGTNGDKAAFVMALHLAPEQLSIAQVRAALPKKHGISLSKKPKLAYLDRQGEIQITALSADTFSQISIGDRHE